MGITPQAAWEQSRADSAAHIRTRPVDEIHRIFLWHETRKVDKTGVIQLAGNRYEVASLLAGKRVDCRYDPYQLDRIFITYQGESYGEAQPLVLSHHRHREAPREDRPPTAPRTGVNLAQLARERHEAERAQATARLQYAEGRPALAPGKEPHHES
nr:Mu transposase C-terminal domain-containing protein [Sulfobacillus harzensis]